MTGFMPISGFNHFIKPAVDIPQKSKNCIDRIQIEIVIDVFVCVGRLVVVFMILNPEIDKWNPLLV